jgi:hypothetical protein
MRDAKAIKFDVWRAATLYLLDHQHELPVDIFNKISGALRARDVTKVCSMSYHPNIGMRPFQIATQVQAFFSKNSDFSSNDVCTAQAITNFKKAESLCNITNKRLRHYAAYPDRCKHWSEVAKMQSVIASVIGSVTEALDMFPSAVRFTSGATESRTKKDSSPYMKIRRTMSISPGAVPLACAMLRKLGVIESETEVYPPRKDSSVRLRLTDFNRVVFVPKNYKTHRSIAAEADFNLPFQLAIDRHIKTKLRRVGIDLGSQKRNQELARQGSLDGSVATIDLRMACDSM